MKIISIIIVGLGFSLHVYGTVDNTLVDDYYSKYSTDDGTAIQSITLHLPEHVPVQDQAELFAKLIAKANGLHKNYAVLANVISVLISKPAEFAWGEALTTQLIGLQKCPDTDVRAVLVNLLGTKGGNKYRSICISFLDDSSEFVRRRAVSAVGALPDSKKVLEAFIDKHKNDSSFEKSCALARSFL